MSLYRAQDIVWPRQREIVGIRGSAFSRASALPLVFSETDPSNALELLTYRTARWQALGATNADCRGEAINVSFPGDYVVDIDWTYTASTLDTAAQHFAGMADSATGWTGVQAWQGFLVGTAGDPAGNRVLQAFDNPRFGAGLDLATGTTYYIRMRRRGTTFFLDVFSTAPPRDASFSGEGNLLAVSKASAQASTWTRVEFINNRNLGSGSSSGLSKVRIA